MNFTASLSVLFVTFSLIFSTMQADAQEKHWVFFTDKPQCDFNPMEYFHQKAIERRIKHNIPLSDPSDWPVSETYVAEVASLVDSIKMQSRWFNAVVVYASEQQVQQLKALAFVREVEEAESTVALAEMPELADTTYDHDARIKEYAYHQLKVFNADAFREAELDGKGVRVAVFDAGFPGVDTHSAFKHLRARNGIVATWDFVKNKEFVYKYSGHGTAVLSNIGGMYDGEPLGLAYGAEFMLARTEIGAREPFSEEENWLAAAEWADKNGADIINSSLGYTYHRYFPEQMDGKTSYITRAANMAASKGILVVNAAGNDGDADWHTIGAPADADSVLSVGGIDPDKGYRISFSSYGPTADKRLKPNVCAFGKAAAAGKTGMRIPSGTSFSSPLVAGFAACALQSRPELTNMQLFREIEQSGHLFPYFDYSHGYGVPQADYFVNGAKEHVEPGFEITADRFIVTVIINEDDFIPTPELESQIPSDFRDKPYNGPVSPYLYYHLQSPQGLVSKYAVVKVQEREILQLHRLDYTPGTVLRVHYRGATIEFTF